MNLELLPDLFPICLQPNANAIPFSAPFLFVGQTNEETSLKFVMAKWTAQAAMAEAQTFLEELAAVPYTIIHRDNGIQDVDTTKNRTGPTAMLRGHPFDRVCCQ